MLKKVMSFILVLSLVFMPALSFNTHAASLIGLGTTASPFLLYTQEDLLQINKMGYNKEFRLMNDIDLVGNWRTIPNFTGILDGNYYAIRNLKITATTEEFNGFFGIVTSSTIKNLTIEGGEIKGTQTSGTFAGKAIATTFENCIANVNLNISVKNVSGGLVGVAYDASKFKRCINKGNVSLSNSSTTTGVGGIVGHLGYRYTSDPGIELSECINTGDITSTGDNVGGIVGSGVQLPHGRWSIINSYNKGDISGNNNVGGIAGILDSTQATVGYCYSAGTIIANGYGAAGIVGKLNGGSTSVARSVAMNDKIISKAIGYIPRRIAHDSSFTKNNLAKDVMELYKESIIKINATTSEADGTATSIYDLQNYVTYQNLGWNLTTIWEMEQGNISSSSRTIFPELRFVSQKGTPLNAVPVDLIELTPKIHTMEAGTTFSIDSAITPTKATNKTLTWSSSDNKVATVNSNGVITAISAGVVNIRAKATSDVSAFINLTVVPSATTTSKYLCMNVDIGQKLTLSVTDDITQNQNFTWSSDNTTIATVDEKGVVTGVATGRCNILVNDEQGFQQLIPIRVFADVNPDSSVTDPEPTDVATPSVTKVNNTDAKIVYGGAWTLYSNEPAFFNGDEHFTNQPNTYAEFKFNGTGINLIGATSDNLGMCDIYIDGSLILGGLDLYSPSLVGQKVLFSKTDLPLGEHTFRLVVSGTKNSSSIDTFVTLDALEYIS